MVGRVRALCRRLGFDIARYPGASKRWPQLVAMLDAQKIDTVVDVGANAGHYARALLANGYGGRILSFEPASAMHAAASEYAARVANWEVAPRAAVGAAAGTVTLNIAKEPDMNSVKPLTAAARRHMSRAAGIATEEVPVVTLADAVPWETAGRVFVKSDTQGYEAEVLDGLAPAMDRVAGLQLELSLVPIYDGQPRYLEMLQRVEGYRFRPHLIVPGYSSKHFGQMLEFDAVCFRES